MPRWTFADFQDAVARLPMRPLSAAESSFLTLASGDVLSLNGPDPCKVGRILQAALRGVLEKDGLPVFDAGLLEDKARAQTITGWKDPLAASVALGVLEERQKSRLVEQIVMVQFLPPTSVTYLRGVLHEHCPNLLSPGPLGLDSLAYHYLALFIVADPAAFVRLLRLALSQEDESPQTH